MFQWINEKYDSPLSVSSDVTIGEGKTVITFWGTGKSIETGEMEEINRDCVLEYELDAEVLHLEETPEQKTFGIRKRRGSRDRRRRFMIRKQV